MSEFVDLDLRERDKPSHESLDHVQVAFTLGLGERYVNRILREAFGEQSRIRRLS